jgi:hypothetical protein
MVFVDVGFTKHKQAEPPHPRRVHAIQLPSLPLSATDRGCELASLDAWS